MRRHWPRWRWTTPASAMRRTRSSRTGARSFGTLRDLMRVKSVGIVEERPELGLVKYAKPVGVVGAVTPSTNPAATPVNKAMMALKGRNAIVIAPSPAGLATTTRAVALMRAALGKVGAPADLVQVLPAPVDKAITNALMAACDLVVVTGSQSNVRAAYRSGTPAIGVGAGNVPVIVDSSAEARRGGGEDCRVQVLRQRNLVLVGERGDHPGRRVRRRGGRAPVRRRPPGECGGERSDPGDPLGGRQAQPPGHRQGFRSSSPPNAVSDDKARGAHVLHGRGDRDRPRESLLRREARPGAHPLSREDLRRRHGQGPRDYGGQGPGPFRRHPHRRRWRTHAGSPRSSIPRASW